MSSRPSLIFDLDNTLIFALSPAELKAATKSGMDLGKFESVRMGEDFTIISRPGLQEFLDWVFDRFSVSVFTAASPHYGGYIVDNIILRGDEYRKKWFNTYLARPHFNESIKRFKVPKSLQLFWDTYKLSGFSADTTLLLDDLVDCAVGQNMCQTIQADYFVASDKYAEKDNFLLATVVPLLEKFLMHHRSGAGGMCLMNDIKRGAPK